MVSFLACATVAPDLISAILGHGVLPAKDYLKQSASFVIPGVKASGC